MGERLLLHEYSLSGNCYKVRLTAAILGLHLDRREYDIMNGGTRTSRVPEVRECQWAHSRASGWRSLYP